MELCKVTTSEVVGFISDVVFSTSEVVGFISDVVFFRTLMENGADEGQKAKGRDNVPMPHR